MARPSPLLYNAVRRGQCQLCDTMPPTFVRLTHQALEGGTAEPSEGNKYVFYGYTGLRHDVRPAGTVHSVATSTVRPSPSLQHHTGHCGDTPDAVEAHGEGTSPCPPLYLVRPPVDSTLESARGRRPNANLYAATLEVAPIRAQDSPRRLNRSEIRQDGRQLRGTARHTYARRQNSAARL
jgi:hypothetical protein